MSGFKSFADDTTITLNAGLNGIIGPNGSGKSNIVEAIKWVMGESSSKNLRGSGMNDVIFNGSASKASKNITQVALTINVDEKNLSKNNKKFVKSGIVEVERQLLRDAGSTYRINGKEVKAKEIQFLFADFSSGSRASNIIDQGTVGNLVTQKPLERRKILDESAGISGITARRIESSNKLEATKRNLERLSDILSGEKERLVELKKQASKAVAFKINKEKIKDLKKKLSIAKLNKAQKQLDNIKKNYLLSKNQLESNNKLLSNLYKEINSKKSDMKKQEEERKVLNDKNLFLGLKIEKAKYEISNNEKELNSLKTLEEQINKNISFQSDILKNSTSRIKDLQENFKEIADLNNKTYDDQTKNGLDRLESALKEIECSLFESNNLLNLKKEAINRFNYDLEMKKNRLNEIRDELSLIKNALKENQRKTKFNKDFNNLINKRNSFERTSINLEKKLDKYNNSLTIEKEKLEKLGLQLSLLNQQEKLLKDKVNEQERNLSSYKSLGVQNVADNILKHVVIRKGYELAFYLAIGDGIEATKNSESLSPVVWERLAAKEMPSLPSKLESLSNYVKAPKELDNFLSQVAIVENEDHGKKIIRDLKNGQIAVTTSGSLWRWDGLYIRDGIKTITYKRITSTTKILKIEKDINKKKNTLKENNSKIEELQKTLKKQEEQYEDYMKKIENTKKEIDNINLELNSTERSLLLISNEKEKEETRLDEKNDLYEIRNKEYLLLKKDIEKLNLSISKESKLIIELKSKVSTSTEKVSELKKKIDIKQIEYAILKQKEDTQKYNYKKISQEIKDTEYQINRTNATLNSLRNDLKEVSKNIITNKSRPRDLNNLVSISQSSILDNNKLLESLNISLREKISEMSELEKKVLKLNQKIENLKENTIRKEMQSEEFNNSISRELREMTDELGLTINEVKEIINKNINLEIDIKETENIIKRLKTKNELVGNVNLHAEEELSELENKIEDVVYEEKDLTNAAKKLEKAIEELNKEARKRVKDTFLRMNTTFSKLFKELFGGGKAFLQLVDSNDPLLAGLELMVSPPGKKLQRLTLLSGGEKALASLALIFSTFINKTTPICILDEVDAPLDDANVEKFNILLKEVSSNSSKRFIIITHNKITMNNMNQIFGITMMEPGVSKIVSVNIDKETSINAAE